jgi:uncharacterized protein YecE (DUF72 family)
MLRHYNIAAVMTDSPPSENLQFLSDVIITASQSFIRFHGRNTKDHYWYNYLYSEQELKPWVNQIREQTRILSIYFNNHYGAKAVVNGTELRLEIVSVHHQSQYMHKYHYVTCVITRLRAILLQHICCCL